jgi:hypothetical protein
VRVWQQQSSPALQSISRRVLFGMELVTCVHYMDPY